MADTRTKVWNVERGGVKFESTAEIVDDIAVKNLLETAGRSDLKVIGASVVPGVTAVINETFREIGAKEPVWIDGTTPLGLTIKYTTPESLGADRVANVLGAMKIGQPSIVVDFGTATKLEAIDREGVYRGGSILPGVRMGLDSLRTGTAQLPRLDPVWEQSSIGHDTASSIQTGTVIGHAHAVAGLIRDYLELLGPSKIIFTGGDREVFIVNQKVGPFRGLDIQQEPRLTLIGLQVAAVLLGLTS